MSTKTYPIHHFSATEVAATTLKRSKLAYRATLGPLEPRQQRILDKLNAMTGWDFKPVLKHQ